MNNRNINTLISTFNDGINNIYYNVEIDRWHDTEHGDYVFTFNGQVEHLSNSPSFIKIIKEVYGEKLLDYKVV